MKLITCKEHVGFEAGANPDYWTFYLVAAEGHALAGIDDEELAQAILRLVDDSSWEGR